MGKIGMFNVFGKKKEEVVTPDETATPTPMPPDSVQANAVPAAGSKPGFIAKMNIGKKIPLEDAIAIGVILAEDNKAQPQIDDVFNTTNEVVDKQPKVEELTDDANQESQQSGRSSELTVAVLDKQVMDNGNLLMLTMYNTILGKMKSDPKVSNTMVNAADWAKNKFVHHISDCIRHGTKANWIRFYRGPVGEDGIGAQVKSLTLNAVTPGQKTYFVAPKQIPKKSEEENDFKKLTCEGIDWTIKTYLT